MGFVCATSQVVLYKICHRLVLNEHNKHEIVCDRTDWVLLLGTEHAFYILVNTYVCGPNERTETMKFN